MANTRRRSLILLLILLRIKLKSLYLSYEMQQLSQEHQWPSDVSEKCLIQDARLPNLIRKLLHSAVA